MKKRFLLTMMSLMLAACASACFHYAENESPDESRPDYAVTLSLPDLLSDHAVLQRSKATNVWGKAAPNTEVKAFMAGKTAKVKSDDKGDWCMSLDLSKVKEGPFNLIITAGEEKLTVKDVLVGEVFLAGGQSNMEKRIGPWTQQYPVRNYEQIAKESSKYTRIRMANIEHKMTPAPIETIPGKWELPNEESTLLFSAAAWFFAVEFQKHNNVPVGIINNSHGGSKMQVWTSKEALVAAGEDPNEEYRGKISTQLWNAEVYPIRNATFKAVLWYQGEQHGNEVEKFEDLFKIMIADWRNTFKNKNLPFIFVQLPSYRGLPNGPDDVNSWARTREAQRHCALDIPGTHMIVCTDTGELTDIHPRDKEPIGERLAWTTLNKLYGYDTPADYPIFKKLELDGSSVIVTFDLVGEGLVAHEVKKTLVNNARQRDVTYVRQSPNAELENFALQNKDGKWYWADDAKIIGKDKIAVSSKTVPNPVCIRYNLSTFSVGNLYGKNGLPANQFEEKIPATK